jgi:hypothetical protein
MQRSVVMDFPYSNALFLGAEKSINPDFYKKEKTWANQGSTYYQNYFSDVNAKLTQDTYQILLMFDKVIVKPADFAVNKEFRKLKFVDLNYPRYDIPEDSEIRNELKAVEPLLVSLAKSFKEKVPIPVFASNTRIVRTSIETLEKVFRKQQNRRQFSPEIIKMKSSLIKERYALDLILNKVIPRVKVQDFNHLLELREDPNLEPFKEKIWQFVNILETQPQKDAINKINKEIDEAARNIRLPCFEKGDKLTAYYKIGLDVASFIPLVKEFVHPFSLIKELKEIKDIAYIDDYRWILFGRTRLKRM